MTLEAAPEVECLCHDALFSTCVSPARKRELGGTGEALRPPAAAATQRSGLTSFLALSTPCTFGGEGLRIREGFETTEGTPWPLLFTPLTLL